MSRTGDNYDFKHLSDEDREAIAALREFDHLAGRAEMAYANESINRIARLRALKIIQDKKLYRYLPGGTMRDGMDYLGYSKTTGYKDLKSLEILGDQTVELLIEQGITSNDSYMLAKAMEGGGGNEFEVLDKDGGEFRVGGQVVTMDGDKGLISSAMLKAIQNIKLQEDALRGKEQQLTKRDDENKKLWEKIRNGEDELVKLRRQLRGPHPKDPKEVTRLSVMLMELIDFVKQIRAEKMTPEDEAARDRVMTLLENQVIGPLTAKFNPRGEDMSDWEREMAGRNEYEDEEPPRIEDYTTAVEEEDEQ